MKKLLLLSTLFAFSCAYLPSDAYSATTKTAAPKKKSAKKSKACVKTIGKCPDKGCGGDPELNKRKNITENPADSDVRNMTIARIIDLNIKSPKKWKSGSDRTPLEEIGEGRAVAVKGYLINAHASGVESCNCFLPGPDNNDVHLNLVTAKDEGTEKKILMKRSLVIETSPRSRKPEWKITTLKALADQRTYVRVTGYLMLDTAHIHFQSMPRATAWEVHPVMKFEVCQGTRTECDRGEKWVALEVL